MVMRLSMQIREAFDKAFPERQIFHRSGGVVQYVSIAPWKQALAAGGLGALTCWCIYASAVVAFGRGDGVDNPTLRRDNERLRRWHEETQAKLSFASATLEAREREYESRLRELEERHETFKTLLNMVADSGPQIRQTAAGDGDAVLVRASIEEADLRSDRQPVLVTTNAAGQAGLRARVNELSSDQDRLLHELERDAVERLEFAQSVLKLSGVDAEIADPSLNDVGGPLVELTERFGTLGDDVFLQRVAKTALRIDQAQRAERLLAASPFEAPVPIEHRETSGYGLRVDPFTRRPAFHHGLDMAAYRRAPIAAAGPGRVTFAGSRPGYGLMVEIDHGFGYKTRYGHLSEVKASLGDDVAIGQRIGSMGSTGRSTGPHLHYEIWFKGKTYDPVPFLRAGKHVSQN
ncbi:MAG TPA: M23 family peptidase [Hyphomonadaceae bacterium]|nr:M23 family peptidase [Hyphomonadaceae bacterium]